MKRRDFLTGTTGLMAATTALAASARAAEQTMDAERAGTPGPDTVRAFNSPYRGAHLNQIAFPLGGIGAGMVCLEGTGALSHVSIRNRPEIFNEPCVFAAIAIKGEKPLARVLEGPVPGRKLFGPLGSAIGSPGMSFGLPRFSSATFEARFPFAKVMLADAALSLEVEITGWSPFEPGHEDDSSLPVAGLEYRFTNRGVAAVDAVFSFNAKNFVADEKAPAERRAVRSTPGGFTLWTGAPPEKPWEESSFSAAVSEPEAKVNHAWFRGDWWDALTLAWKDVEQAKAFDAPPPSSGAPSPGASIFVPLSLAPGASRTIALRLSWFSGRSSMRSQDDPFAWPWPESTGETYRPWYAGRFADIEAINAAWRDRYQSLRQATQRFADCFHASTLPPEVMEAVSANLTILRSPTILRQIDGRLWGWEGCDDNFGAPGGTGSCTHVWNYAQSMPHLFPALERTLRESEFGPSQNEEGHQAFRHALPIRPCEHKFYAAADGQLGGIMKVHREWRISGNTAWLKKIWPSVKKSLDYCIKTWDPGHGGLVEEPHHNTYDIEFWGPDGMCSSFYLGALQAAAQMGRAVSDRQPLYESLAAKAKQRLESELFNGEYFRQKVERAGFHGPFPLKTGFFNEYSPDTLALFEKEGPKYQYGEGCLSDGVLGAWMALVCGVGEPLDHAKVKSHLAAIHRHNLKTSLAGFANPQRPTYAAGTDGGLLLCTWPRGGALSLPFVYSNEVWTGIEYQCASHMIRLGLVAEGLEVVRTCRARYDGRVRNPFDEYEYGHWYARAMSSYALLEAMSGAHFDAVEKILYLKPAIKGDFLSFLSTATGYGTVGVKGGKPFVEVMDGQIPYRRIDYTAA
ncbi:MAG TPA: GH116 family glycosyl hydrolase [Rhizomicrobium sp.]|nr:GH116 family glycosyl hydrolase [Rhizomicrobium sp.]